jgi:hypothetical protein
VRKAPNETAPVLIYAGKPRKNTIPGVGIVLIGDHELMKELLIGCPGRGIGALGMDYYYICHWIYFEGDHLPRTEKEPPTYVASLKTTGRDGRNNLTSSRGFPSGTPMEEGSGIFHDLPEGHYRDNPSASWIL